MVFVISMFIRSTKEMLRSPAHLALVIVFPVVFAACFAFIFGGGADMFGESASYTIAVVNNDEVNPAWEANFSQYVVTGSDIIFEEGFASYFFSSLEQETPLTLTETAFRVENYTDVTEAINQVRSRTVTMCIVIPDNFSRGMIAGINYKVNLTEGSPVDPAIEGGNVTLEIHGDSSYQTFQELQTVISEAVDRFTSHFYGLDFPGGQLDTSSVDVTSRVLTPYDQYIPGFLVFAVLLGSASIAFIIGDEQSHGTLDRLKVSNIKPLEYLLGLTFSQFISLSIQVLIMLLAGYLFGFQGKGNPLYAFIVGSLTVIPVLGIGLIIASLDKTGKNSPGIAAIISAPMGFISGAFLPLPEIVLLPDIVPTGLGGVRDLLLWDFFPFTQAVRAERLILLNQYTLLQVWPEIFLLLIGGMPIFIAGVVLFTWRLFKE